MSKAVADLFSCGQIRLAELSVCNWGSFHGLHTARIDPEGTLITGDNGAGKSTLIDGLMALLLSSKASFNMAAAQGDRSDRSLVSYIRGSHGSSHDGAQTKTNYKRDGAVVSGLRAMYLADDGSVITLAVLFWNTQASNAVADFKRIYLVAKRELTLEELLKAFGEGEARQLKKTLRDDPQVKPFEVFADYQAYYRDCLHMDNRNAPNLLSRALGLKKIDDLTGLIRELVLEPSHIREDARSVVREFDDLVATHAQLLDARNQQGKLSALPDIEQTLTKCETQISSLRAERQGLPAYFGEISAALWRDRIEQINQELSTVAQQLSEFRRQEADAEQQVEQRHADYVQAGGDRVEAARETLAQIKRRLAEVSTAAGLYQTAAAQAGLDNTLSEPAFNDNQARINIALAQVDQDNEKAQDSFADAANKLANETDKLRKLQQEIHDIESHPDSNIDPSFLAMRNDMVTYLALDKEQLMFIGELVDVLPEQLAWKGAIVRALGGLSTTLAVPQEHYSLVTRWLNSRHMGLHVRVQVVKAVSGAAQFHSDGYLRKLVWRDHPYREWLKHHLARFDLHCVDSSEQLDVTPYSMTQAGLVHMDKGRFEKKDQTRINDQRKWPLGFSNKDKLAMLRQDEKNIQTRIAMCNKETRLARQDLNAAQDRTRLWETLAQYQWDNIDVARWKTQEIQAQSALDELTRAGSDAAQAQQAWDVAKVALKNIQRNKDEAQKREGVIENRLAQSQTQLAQANRAAELGLDDGTRTALTKRVAELSEFDIDRVVVLEEEYRRDIDAELSKLSAKNKTSQHRAVSIMSAFRTEWPAIASEWGGDIRSLFQYIEHLTLLSDEGLPALVEQFRERLTKCAMQSLAGVRSSMDSEREEIKDRIDIINRVLKRTEFKQGSYLRLRTKKESYPHVDDFNRRLTRVLGNQDDDEEAQFLQLKSIIEILEKASNPTTANTLESQRLLDPRYQLSFYAEEVDADTGDILDVLDSSSGKSGGEKESFAGTIVAASLAYVLTPDGADQPVYCTVFLDEAFSNTAEAVSRRVLKVFRELKIHVNLITPYKNLNLARESARSLLIAERDSATHESQLCEVTWEQVDQQLQAQREEKLNREVLDMGVVLELTP